MSDIQEILSHGISYRGPFPPHKPGGLWKITAYLPSDQKSTSGQPVRKSWQTWRKYLTESAALSALEALKT